jgi:hypothetical protein
VAVHRFDLHQVLLEAAGPELVRTGAQVIALDQDKDGVRVTWEGGAAHAGLVVAADGLHSTLRRAWFGEASRPRFTGRTAWRAVLDHATGEGDEATESWGRGQRFGIVPMGRGRVYWFAAADAPEHQRAPTGEQAELLARFAGWHPPIPELIAATPPAAVLRHDLYELRPRPAHLHQGPGGAGGRCRPRHDPRPRPGRRPGPGGRGRPRRGAGRHQRPPCRVGRLRRRNGGPAPRRSLGCPAAPVASLRPVGR